MKKIIICFQILLNIVIILFAPIIPVEFIGGIMDNGDVYTRNEYFTISFV